MEKNAVAQEWDALCNAQGWDAEVQVIHLEGFLYSKGLMAEFLAYAKQAAQEENEDN